MKNFIPALLLLVLTTACNEQPQENSTPGSIEETGTETSDKVQELTLQIRQNPKKASLYKQRAEAYLEESMLLLALEDIDRALLIDSTSADFHALKGDIQYMNKAPDKAVRSFERALELDPENTDALLKMAEIQLLLRQYQKCFDYANRALRVNEQLYMAYFIKGYAHFELGDSTLFVSSVQTALELNPDFFDGFTMLGSFYASLESDLALDYYNSALDLRPDHPEALYGKAMHLQNTGRLEEAIEIYEQLISLNNEHLYAWYNQGYIWLEIEGEPEKAIPFFEKAIELNPAYVDAIYNLGLSYERMNQMAQAEQYYRQALEVDPQYDLAALGLERIFSN